jgi:hypothetical protein
VSYILDALKKAEADADPDARASLAIAQHERRRTRLLAYGLVIALIINAGILLWLFLPVPDSLPVTNPVPRVPAMQSTPADPPAAEPESAAQPDPAAQVRQMIDKPPAMTTESATGDTVIRPGGINPGSTAADPASEPVPVDSLPRDQRRRFPVLEFSTHIYADEADLRAIVVNGVRLKEGDRLDNVRLQEITEAGAVFAFENRLVSVSVLDSWN